MQLSRLGVIILLLLTAALGISAIVNIWLPPSQKFEKIIACKSPTNLVNKSNPNINWQFDLRSGYYYTNDGDIFKLTGNCHLENYKK